MHPNPARRRLERLVRLYRRRTGAPHRGPLTTWLGQPLATLTEAECRLACRQFGVLLDNLAGSHRSQLLLVVQSPHQLPARPSPRPRHLWELRPHLWFELRPERCFELWFEFWLRWWGWPLSA